MQKVSSIFGALCIITSLRSYRQCNQYLHHNNQPVICNMKLVVTEDEEKLQLVLKNASGELGLTIGKKFGICHKGYENERL